ncbi:MAG: hypothetical protein LBR70_00100 [Lactobacillaceae bacterium]|jgi:hypothetical protein|nr:hypothetical protein [Lactobacillaceae bacterium]
MRKVRIICILVLCSFFVFGIENASAGVPKVDIPGLTGKFTEGVSRITDKVSEKFKNIERKINESFIGKGIKEAKSLYKKGKDKVDGITDKVEDKVDGVKDKVGDKVDVVKDKVDDKTGGLKDKIESGKDKVDGAIDTAEDATGANSKQAKELASLEYKRSEIASEYDTQISAKRDVSSGSLAAIDENIATITAEMNKEGVNEDQKLQYQSQLDNLNTQREDIAASGKLEESQLNDQKKLAVKDLDSRIAEIRKSMESGFLSTVKNKSDKYWGARDTQSAMENDRNALFLKEGDPETSDNVRRMMAVRRADALAEAINATYVSMSSRITVEARDKEVKDMSDYSTVLESQNASISLDMNVKVEELRALLEYNKVLLAEMRFKSASSRARVNDYTVRDEGRDITKFNFDDYSFDKYCRKTGGSK